MLIVFVFAATHCFADGNTDGNARSPYRTLCRLANVEFDTIPGVESQAITLTARSTRPNVKPKDIRLSIETEEGSEQLAPNGNGIFEIPLDCELFDANAVIVSNQPKGSMFLRASFKVRPAPVLLSDHLAAHRLKYAELVDLAVAARNRVKAKADNLADKLRPEHPTWRDAFPPVVAILVWADKSFETATVAMEYNGQVEPLHSEGPGRFVIEYNADWLSQDRSLIFSANHKWLCGALNGNAREAREPLENAQDAADTD